MNLARRLLSQSSIIFGGRLFGAGLTFLVQAFFARFWGAAILGEYLVIMASVNLISVAMPLGFQTVGTYFGAEYRARGDRRQLLAFMIRSHAQIAAIFLLIVFGGPVLLMLLGQSDSVLAQHFVPVALLALGTALVALNGGLLIGLKKPFSGLFADGVFRPTMILTVMLICVFTIATPIEGFSVMLWAISVGYLVIAVGQLSVLIAAARGVPDTVAERSPEVARWWRFAAPWVVIALATDFFFDIDLLLLTNLLDREELAIFGVCTRIFSLVAFGVAAVYAVALPDMFESEAKADRSSFHRKVGEANLGASLVSMGLLVVVVIGAPFALSLFGPSFTAGAIPLAILCLALVVRSVFGPASMVLSIHDRPWASLPAVALGMGTLVVGNWILVPMFHLTGAALAALLATSIWSVSLWLIVLRTAKMDVSLRQWFITRRALAAAE
jgi:O-antigen/teichoic acid export membrane protein